MAATLLWTLEAVALAPGRLRGVTLEIRAGVTAVLGCSGAGKTSLLNVLVGFPSCISSGSFGHFAHPFPTRQLWATALSCRHACHT